MKIRILSAADVREAVTMGDAIAAVKDAYIQLSSGQAQIPLRTPVPVDEHSGVTLLMPAYLAGTDDLGAKIVSVFPRNASVGLPTIHAVLLLVNARTGEPLAMMDGTYLTALRTGAASGVATELLARSDAKKAAIFGAGAQARTQVRAICAVRPIERIRIYDPLRSAAAAFAQELNAPDSAISATATVAVTPEQATSGADVVCTVTTSRTPVFDDDDLSPGVHLNALGAFTPEMQEVPGATVVRASLFVDSIEACLSEAGDIVIPLSEGLIEESHIRGELGQVAAGLIPGRQSDDEITLFKSVGVAVQDVAVASLVLERSAELGLGIDVEL
ncbi:ornithine cyclodeaminase family protein [Chloroflexota bacterium]